MKNSSQNPERTKLPTIQQIRREHHLTSRIVAAEAHVDFRTEYLLEIGAFVDPGEALKVLKALSMLTGEQYTLENVGGLCISAASVPSMKKEHPANSRYS